MKANFSSSLLAVLLCSTLALTACDKTKSPDKQEAATDAAKTEAKGDSNNDGVDANSAELTLARITSEGLVASFIDPVIQKGELTVDQKSCLKNHDKNIGLKEAQAYYKDHFTDAELEELNSFYASEVGQHLVKYGNQQILMESGFEVKDPVAPPSDEQMAEVVSIMQKPAFQKYQQLNTSQDEGSLYAELRPVINDELARCNIDYAL